MNVKELQKIKFLKRMLDIMIEKDLSKLLLRCGIGHYANTCDKIMLSIVYYGVNIMQIQIREVEHPLQYWTSDRRWI